MLKSFLGDSQDTDETTSFNFNNLVKASVLHDTAIWYILKAKNTTSSEVGVHEQMCRKLK